MSDFRLCAVCGTDRGVLACDRCSTSFCSRHTDHDCPTPRSGEREFGRESGLGVVRGELERELADPRLLGRPKQKVSVRVDSPGDWDQSDAVRASLAAADEEALRVRQLRGPSFSSERKEEQTFPGGIPMSREGNRPSSWVNPNRVKDETDWVTHF